VLYSTLYAIEHQAYLLGEAEDRRRAALVLGARGSALTRLRGRVTDRIRRTVASPAHGERSGRPTGTHPAAA
jgi:hypothetical protein